MSVKTNTLGELIEFQFQLYETEKSKNSGTYNIIDKVIGVENFFINPKSNDYLIKVKNAIEKLFLDSNKIPQANLEIYEQRIIRGDSILLPLNESILFDGSNSGDFDSEIIHYEWRNIPNSDETYQTFDKLTFQQGEKQQVISISDSGPYKIGFKVYDGVSYSEEIIFKINTIKKPKKLRVLDSTIFSYHKLSLFNLKPKVSQTAVIYLDTKGNSENELNKIFITNEKIQEQFIESENLDFALLKKYNENNISEMNIVSEFPAPEITRENEIYLYSLGDDNIVSEPAKVNHELIMKSVLNVHVETGPIALMSSGESLKTIDGIPFDQGNNGSTNVGQTSIHLDLGLGLLLNENLEIGASFGILTSDKAYYKDFVINLSSTFNSWLSYTLITKGKFNPYIGVKLSTYKYNEIEKESQSAISIGGLIGVKYNIYDYNKFSCDLKINYSYGRFIENNLSDLYTNTMGVGTILRF